MSKSDTIDRLAAGYVVPVIRTHDRAQAERACDVLALGGMQVFEIAATVPGAGDLAGTLSRRGHVVGIGSVLAAADAEAAIAAGARFVAAPAIVPEVVAACRAGGVACLLGALTPNEVRAAVTAGADAVRLFPVSAVGGPDYVKALKSILPGVVLAATGGISVDDIPGYRKAGADFLGIGGTLVADAVTGDVDPAALKARLAALIGSPG